ncbi:hypothetical protein HF086_018181 [Spodoptera exigua]|uniref:Uncharacterized protein n=1 Tax=Spodoptera exigua TaxID=7107 RepID=A0A922MLY1_SPOEX|nr:hypothetical protein HF086_018181 [Spodoptera exigua]
MLSFQELRCREEELTRAQLQQRLMEQNLAQKERELEMREIDLVARELHILIFASNMSANQPPQPNKRKGKFSKIKLLKKDTISSPLDFRHTLTVRPSEDESSVKQLVAVAKDTPPGSPAIMRAIALPADGVKGKTWGPSTVHQRSRTQLPLGAAAPLPRPRHARFSSSAPDLPPASRTGNARRRAPPAAPPAPPAPRKRSGSHDDLLYENIEPRRNRFLLCPMFASNADLPHHYDAVFDVPLERSLDRSLDRARRKPVGSKGNLFKTIRSNSLAGLLAVAGSLSSDTTELLRDE